MRHRRKTPTVAIGSILMGSEHPIVIQSMTNTPTARIEKTVEQIKSLTNAGSELVRLTINDKHAAEAVPAIVAELKKEGYTTPLIGDFHYNGHILLSEYPETAQCLAKYRINPGNVGKGNSHNNNFATMVNIAKLYNKPIRIGVNWGSLDPDLFTKMMDANAALAIPLAFKEVVIQAMVESALSSLNYAQSLGLSKERIVLSVKMSEVQDMIRVYELLSKKTDCVLHIGLTEAGAGRKGLMASAAALSVLLQQGIGDTLRISLTPEPGVPRSEEVKACTTLLQSMDFRFFQPVITSCPGCGRTDSDYFIHLAEDVNTHIENKIKAWRSKFPGVEKLKIAVMGCVVNGPGESKYADIGISLPGIREIPTAPVYIDGKLATTLRGEYITEEFIALLDNYIQKRYQSSTSTEF